MQKKNNPNQWTSIPLLAKIFKLLDLSVDQNIQKSEISSSKSIRHKGVKCDLTVVLEPIKQWNTNIWHTEIWVDWPEGLTRDLDGMQ